MPAKSLLVKDAYDEIVAAVKSGVSPLGYTVKLEEGAQEEAETLTVNYRGMGVFNSKAVEDPAMLAYPPLSTFSLAFELELYGPRERASDTEEKQLQFWEAFERLIDLPYDLNGLSRKGHKYARIYFLEGTDEDEFAATQEKGIRKIPLTLICEARRIA